MFVRVYLNDFDKRPIYYHNINEVIDEILDDYIDMFNRLGDIQEVIDKWVQEEDENKNIDKLMQEGEDHEL